MKSMGVGNSLNIIYLHRLVYLLSYNKMAWHDMFLFLTLKWKFYRYGVSSIKCMKLTHISLFVICKPYFQSYAF